MKTSLTVVIATAGRPELLKRTLASLSGCRLPESYRATLVVENGPKHGVDEIVRNAHPRLAARYLYERAANNRLSSDPHDTIEMRWGFERFPGARALRCSDF